MQVIKSNGKNDDCWGCKKTIPAGELCLRFYNEHLDIPFLYCNKHGLMYVDAIIEESTENIKEANHVKQRLLKGKNN